VGRQRSDLVAAAGELTILRDREGPSGRLLRQGDMDASYVDLADARHLEFDYLRRMRDLVEATGARRVVHVGGAGCALARALADLARVAGLAAVNVVDSRPLDEAAAIAAGLQAAFPHVLALGGAAVLAKRRGGNVVLAGMHGPPPLERLRARAAADRSPGGVLGPAEMEAFSGGAPPLRDRDCVPK
jgi:hypothetical protein